MCKAGHDRKVYDAGRLSKVPGSPKRRASDVKEALSPQLKADSREGGEGRCEGIRGREVTM